MCEFCMRDFDADHKCGKDYLIHPCANGDLGVRAMYHALRYTDKNGEESVQFITINVEKEASSDGGA